MPRFSIAAYGLATAELLPLAQAAEQAGFELLWLGEHLVIPSTVGSSHPTSSAAAADPLDEPVLSPGTVLNDPWVSLAAVAAGTTRLRLATGILVLPLQHPLLVARAAATLQALSGDRFSLGVGAGWVREEFDALGISFDERGSRFDEQLDILRAAWAGGAISYRGGHFSFDDVQVCGDQVRVPIVVGGHSPPALRRAARNADGWLSSGVADLDEAVRCRDELHRLRAGHHERPFVHYVRLAQPDPDLVAGCVARGFEDLVLWADQLWPRDPSIPVSEKAELLSERAARLRVLELSR
ncbi:MAG: TIGR03619 family F420-dependent LLM class oxidoreductase [Mycobacteriales bacterium]